MKTKKHQYVEANAPRLVHPAASVRQALCISGPTFYNLVHAGKLKMVKIGGRTFVTDRELRRFLADLETAA